MSIHINDFRLGMKVWWFDILHGTPEVRNGEITILKGEYVGCRYKRLFFIGCDEYPIDCKWVFKTKEEAIDAAIGELIRTRNE